MAKATIVKKVENGVLYSDGLIKIENVRLSHPHLDKPYKGKEDKADAVAKYSVTAMLPKNTHKAVKDLLVEVIKKMEVEAKVKWASDKKFIRNGDDTAKSEYEGHWIISAREERPPILRDQQKRNVERTEAASVFYGGCYGTIIIRPWAQNNSWGKRVNAGLSVVQKVKDGPAFGEGRISDDDADDLLDEVEDDDADLGGDDDNDDL